MVQLSEVGALGLIRTILAPRDTIKYSFVGTSAPMEWKHDPDHSERNGGDGTVHSHTHTPTSTETHTTILVSGRVTKQ